MSIINRLSGLVRADLNAVLDVIEDPLANLRQAVRDMSEALALDEQRLRELDATRTRLGHDRDRLAERNERNEKDLDTCFAAHKDELARTLIRRRLELQRMTRQLAERSEQVRRERDTIAGQLEERREQLEALKFKVAALTSVADPGPSRAPSATNESISDEDVEVAFLDEMSRRSEAS